MRVVFLGTGGTYPCTERNVTSVAVQLEREVILLDCGEGTQRQFMRSNVSFMNIRWIFISHFHGDHFLGLPGLIQSMNLNDRVKPLDIYGPPGTIETLGRILTAGHFSPAYEINGHEMQPGDCVDLEGFSVMAACANHTVPTLAFAVQEDDRPGRFNKQRAIDMGIPEGPLFRRLQQGQAIEHDGRRIEPSEILGPPRPGRRLVYSGDSRPSKEVVELSRNADLLIHDATLLQTDGETAASYGHSTALEAAKIAAEAGVRALALVHFSPRYKDTESLVEEAKTVFPNVFAPKDLDEYIIKLPQ